MFNLPKLYILLDEIIINRNIIQENEDNLLKLFTYLDSSF